MYSAQERVQRGRQGQLTYATLFVLRSGKDVWETIPLDLSWKSMISGNIFTSWPPEYFDSVVVENNILICGFHDQLNNYERSILPWELDAESLWKAVMTKYGR